jgi:hypothetical protein
MAPQNFCDFSLCKERASQKTHFPNECPNHPAQTLRNPVAPAQNLRTGLFEPGALTGN